MKKRELEKRFTAKGWKFLTHGGKHDIWVSPTGKKEQIPRHREVNEDLAKGLIKKHKL
ncbi:type II toxin-antitoxin system HicA family toxin [Lysinibacillus sp. NPDC093197]|uniref:type II toxin-antitoxin system HicA family toxin n=1 Tax=Lysinibacillus sp. NPDC093197 TaxID=3364132 RepID=UPI0038159E29